MELYLKKSESDVTKPNMAIYTLNSCSAFNPRGSRGQGKSWPIG